MNADQIVTEILNNNTETEAHEEIEEMMYDFLDEDDIAEYADVVDAYSELGRGEAESQYIQSLLNNYETDIDTYCEVSDRLCEEWGISTD